MTPTLSRQVWYGDAVHSKSLTEIEYLTSSLIGVDETGAIAFVERASSADEIERVLHVKGWTGVEVTRMGKGEFLCPGRILPSDLALTGHVLSVIDTHTHAPQYVNLAFGQQFELLDWLSNVTFPAEAQFKDAAYARRAYEEVVQRNLSVGTTTVCYYGTLHLTTQILAAICHRKGQRAFVGKCNMDRNSSDEYVEASPSQSLLDTKKYVDFVRSKCCSPIRSTSESSGSNLNINGLRSDLVQPIITPRFAISCSDELLKGLGDMVVKDPSLPIQTHLSENPTEVEFTKSLFPFVSSYTEVYDHFNLLRENTVLAHCVHLEDSEISLIKQRRAGISHCPDSNFNLRSGITPITTLLDRGIKVSLGTDISGGTSLGILSAIRTASFASKTLIFNSRDAKIDDPNLNESIPEPKRQKTNGSETSFANRHLSIETLFYLATMGGAQVCCLEDRIGNFVVGKEFDALLIRTGQKPLRESAQYVEGSEDADAQAMEALSEGIESDFPDASTFGPHLFVEPEDGLQKVFEKFLFSGDDRNIAKVFVRGRKVGGRDTLYRLSREG
ncbi:BZ3500_MvSof-1268-A1-R1_Chr3-1g06043 [Microbotryum saponariae]|uniref:Probable guanine deaminase n=1 Tax=Microbotryum saponariae TaxID=289078 RepID=A0A2X0KZ56_9BASI|nr:BZ3500_MvSof-1268-A1-R1_Chr3-1g06043 [Microbotryum saponariae]SDA03854.1 BZ3501_MvSof-1269-A2-R1_Chr3-2g05728 [Microbotryum saponariae]